MANKPGGIVGLSVALLLVGGLAATPFYLGMLRSDTRALDAAVEDDVEALRRIVLNLDEDVMAFASMAASVDADKPEPSDEGYKTPPGFPDDDPVFSRQLLRNLKETIDTLERVEAADRDRGTTVLGTETVDRRRLKVTRVTTDFKAKYLKAGDKLLRDAESKLTDLRNISHGAASATSHLGVNRIKGIYLLAKGRIQAGTAQFERRRASMLRSAAHERVPSLLELRRQETTLDAQMPGERLSAIDQQLAQLQAGAKAVQGAMAQLGGVIQSRQDQLNELEKTAAEARQDLSELSAQRLGFAEYSSRYLELSEQLRKAESDVSAIRYGTLRNATLVEPAGAEPEPPSYDGGTPEPGLDALTFRLEELKEQQSLLADTQKELEQQRGELADLEQSLTAQRDDVASKVQAQAVAVAEELAQADEHEQKALKAEEAAVKTLKEALRAARDAATAAKRMASDARQAAGSGGTVDERLQRVSQDVDTEASMQCLAAECAYLMAQLGCEHAVSIREQTRIAALMAELTGTNAAPPADDLDKIQTEAANYAADALKAYDQAATLIGRSTVKSGTTSISGKNYLWQVQVGEAAVHLLQASIHVEDAEKNAAEKSLAYNLLKEAAEKREQSLLLAPAIETIVYLQQTAQ